jgi:hypothetical protein
VRQDRCTRRHPARVDARATRLPATRPFALTAWLATLLLATTALAGGARRSEAPARLADTGLYARTGAETLARGVRTWTPQYPLWSDGATKRRWILLPGGDRRRPPRHLHLPPLDPGGEEPGAGPASPRRRVHRDALTARVNGLAWTGVTAQFPGDAPAQSPGAQRSTRPPVLDSRGGERKR